MDPSICIVCKRYMLPDEKLTSVSLESIGVKVKFIHQACATKMMNDLGYTVGKIEKIEELKN